MKRLLSIITSADTTCDVPDNAEIIKADGKAPFGDFIKAAIKRAAGKYVLLTDCNFALCDLGGFLCEVKSRDDDVIAFDGGTCFKPALIKGIKRTENLSAVEIFAAMSAKSVYKTHLKPLEFFKSPVEYSKSLHTALKEAVEEFAREKAKLAREVYAFVFETLIKRLTEFYMAAMLKMRKDLAVHDPLCEFDRTLKDNVVLYLALEKRFPYVNLSKLREKNFKISFFTARKFKKYLKQ